MLTLTAQVDGILLGPKGPEIKLRFEGIRDGFYNELKLPIETFPAAADIKLGAPVTFFAVTQDVADEISELRRKLRDAQTVLEEYQRETMEQDMTMEEALATA